MLRSTLLRASAALGLSLLASLPARAQTLCAASVAYPSTADNNVSYSVTVGQSFTVACSGQVSTVVLTPHKGGADDFRGSDYFLKVRILNAAGTTLGTSAQTDQFYPGSTATFDLSDASVLLVAGTTYRWELFSDRATAENFPLYLMRFAKSNVYAAGQLYLDGTANAAQDVVGWTVNVVTPTLPVELVAFTGAADGRTARLAWTTASETNNVGFVVERQTGAEAWAQASGLVAGRGTTTERTAYAYAVEGLTAGRHVFRLRQIDTDGTVHYSPTATVEVGVEGGEGRVTLLGRHAVRIEANAPQALTVTVADVLGRIVSSQQMTVNGTAEAALPPHLPAGAYVVRVVGERFVQTRRLVVR